MPNYQQSDVSGVSWKRASRIVLENPINSPGGVLIVEEVAMDLGDGTTLTNPVGNLGTVFQPGALINLYNPLTGLPTGATITHDEFYAMAYSVYMTLAAERDALQQPQE